METEITFHTQIQNAIIQIMQHVICAVFILEA